MSDFAIDASTAQWIMSIYPLVSGIMVPVSAFLIDKFSTRALFFGATLVFALAVAGLVVWTLSARRSPAGYQ